MEDNKQTSWYYEKQGKQIGPVSAAAIQVMVEANTLSYGDMVWQKGSPTWLKLEESELKHLLADRPPLLNLTSKKKYKMNKKSVEILRYIILVGCSFNFFIACQYVRFNSYSIAISLNKREAELTVVDKVNAFLGSMATLGIAPKQGTKMFDNINPVSYCYKR